MKSGEHHVEKFDNERTCPRGPTIKILCMNTSISIAVLCRFGKLISTCLRHKTMVNGSVVMRSQWRVQFLKTHCILFERPLLSKLLIPIDSGDPGLRSIFSDRKSLKLSFDGDDNFNRELCCSTSKKKNDNKILIRLGFSRGNCGTK